MRVMHPVPFLKRWVHFGCKKVHFAEICREIDYHSKKGKAAELIEMTLKDVVGRIGIEPITY